jgi:hypothetical protein
MTSAMGTAGAMLRRGREVEDSARKCEVRCGLCPRQTFSRSENSRSWAIFRASKRAKTCVKHRQVLGSV